MERLVKLTTSEASSLQKRKDYNLTKFIRSKTIETTSASLLKLVSELVSNGKGTTTSLSLAQAIHAHVTNSPNQTAEGLAVKIHLPFGSKELNNIAHEYCYTCTLHWRAS